VLLDAWQPHGAIWLPFGPLAPVAPVLPGLPLVPKSPLRVAGRRHATPSPHLPSEAGSRLRLFLGVRRSDGHSAASAATANVSSARVESGPDFKGDTGLSQSG
jgi:hypothetical protein